MKKRIYAICIAMLLGFTGCGNFFSEESGADEIANESEPLYISDEFPVQSGMPENGQQQNGQQNGQQQNEQQENGQQQNGQQNEQQQNEQGNRRLEDICLNLYNQAAKENQLPALDTIRGIAQAFGENGYPAVDSANQIDMTESEQVVRFCEKVEAKESGEITIIEIGYWGGFTAYDLRTKDGQVEVVRKRYKYENGEMQKGALESYPADYWSYTPEGYLMFSGICFPEDFYILTLGREERHTALRVEPLDETCRALNRKFLLPIGYERNNMFLTDWGEDDFGNLDFYDMYDIFYPKMYGKPVPYAADDNLAVGAVYRIPQDEFEGVIMTYFNIDSETLQSKTLFHPEDRTYEYRPRGFYEVEYPEYPYPEVTGYTENGDGTIALLVNVVFPFADDSRVYTHEVVVRPLEDGGVQYVSNRIIPSEDNQEATWYMPRLTQDAWQEVYGSGLS